MKKLKLLRPIVCTCLLSNATLPLAGCSCTTDKEFNEWAYDWINGKAYVNPVSRSKLEFVDIENNGFNNAYLAEIANNKQILASDILESINHVWAKQSGSASQKSNDVAANILNISVNQIANNDFTLSFKLVVKANITGWNNEAGVNKLEEIKQNVDLTFTNVKLIADHNFHFQVNLDNTSTNWSVKGTMSQKLGDAEEAKLTVDLAAGKTDEIAAFKAFAYNSNHETLVLDSLTAYYLEDASTIDWKLTEKDKVKDHTLTFTKLYNKTKTITGKIEVPIKTENFWPKVEIICEYTESGATKEKVVGSWTTYDVTKDDQEFTIDVNGYTISKIESEDKKFYIKLTLQEYKPLEFQISTEIEEEVKVVDDCPKHIIVNTENQKGWRIPFLKFQNTDETKIANLWQYSLQMFAGKISEEKIVFDYYIEKYPNYQEMMMTSLYGSDKIESEKVIVVVGTGAKMEAIPVTSSLILPENIYLSLDDVDYYPLPPYMLVLEDDYYMMYPFYACIEGKYTDQIKRIKFTLLQGDKSWSEYAYLNGESPYSQDVEFILTKDDGIDPDKPLDMTAEVLDACFAQIYWGSTPEHWWFDSFEPEYYIQKEEDGKLHFKAKIKHDNSITADTKLKFTCSDDRCVYCEKHFTVPVSQEEPYVLEWVQDWDENLNNKHVKMSLSFDE